MTGYVTKTIHSVGPSTVYTAAFLISDGKTIMGIKLLQGLFSSFNPMFYSLEVKIFQFLYSSAFGRQRSILMNIFFYSRATFLGVVKLEQFLLGSKYSNGHMTPLIQFYTF